MNNIINILLSPSLIKMKIKKKDKDITNNKKFCWFCDRTVYTFVSICESCQLERAKKCIY